MIEAAKAISFPNRKNQNHWVLNLWFNRYSKFSATWTTRLQETMEIGHFPNLSLCPSPFQHMGCKTGKTTVAFQCFWIERIEIITKTLLYQRWDEIVGIHLYWREANSEILRYLRSVDEAVSFNSKRALLLLRNKMRAIITKILGKGFISQISFLLFRWISDYYVRILYEHSCLCGHFTPRIRFLKRKFKTSHKLPPMIQAKFR